MRSIHFACSLLLCTVLACAVGCTPPASPAGPTNSGSTPTTDGDDVDQTDTSANETSEAADTDTAAVPTGPDVVLRHAVFFKFKDSSSKEDVQKVVDAFRALPKKIDSIIDFEWGVNNSPEPLDDGFTHCFFLTFKDSAGLEEYIPHPAHKGEFADVLRPHMEKVFVVDYYGKQREKAEKELRHLVFFKFKDDAAKEKVEEVVAAFADLPNKIDAIHAFEMGVNNSPEKKNDGFTHAFNVTFTSEEGRAEYLPHEAHEAFVELLKPHLDKARVLDFWASE